MNTKPKIAILLSTFNGEKYLAEQLDSILSQSYDNFLIVVRDDGSSDETVSVLQAYLAANPGRFHLIDQEHGNHGNRGASGSFSYLIEYVLARKVDLGLGQAYMMFCDQDDIWYANKIEDQVAAMLKAEQEDIGKAEGHPQIESSKIPPVLIHSDLQVVSEKNELIARSFIKYQGLEIKRNHFQNLVVSNLVTGCTAFFNEALAEKAVPVSDKAIMHDWWMALVATAFGKLIFLDEPLVHYRQHGNNTIGAKEFIHPASVSRSFWQRVFSRKVNEHLIEVAIQASDFKQRFGKQLSARQNMGLRISSIMNVRIGMAQRVAYRITRSF